MKKLTSGRGNLVSRIEKFREMGVQTSKRIANEWLDDDDSDADSKSVPHDRK